MKRLQQHLRARTGCPPARWVLLSAAAAALLLPGCRPRQPEAAAAPVIPTIKDASELLDGFEGPEHTVWAFDAADDEADAAYVQVGATQGARALRVTLRKKGRTGKVHLRREVRLDLSKASALTVDLTSPAEGVGAALALKCDPGEIWQECRPVVLKSGLNRGVRFPLAAPNWKNAQSNWQYAAAPVNLDQVQRLILLLYTGDQASGAFLLDNLRLEGDAQKACRAWRPEIFSAAIAPSGTQYETLETAVIFRASYTDVFDPDEIAVGLRVSTPSGRDLSFRGFFAGLTKWQAPASAAVAATPPWGPFTPDTESSATAAAGTSTPPVPPTQEDKIESGRAPDEVPAWRVRFTPYEVGRYAVQLWVRNREGETRAPVREIVVVPQAAGKALPGRRGGPVLLSRRDPRRLELHDGAPFFVFGQNVCWSRDWEPYFQKISAYGGNTSRIWLCPWGLNLERKTEPGVYDLETAGQIDELFGLAEKHGVRLVFCFTFHGVTAQFWRDSPYARVNGGPCARAEEFFVEPPAKRQFKRLLSYAAARWGASPALLAWEIINEPELAKFYRPEDVENWVREMAGHMKWADAHGHLVTVGTSRPDFQPRMWEHPALDLITVHGYGPDVSRVVAASLEPWQTTFKPALLSEFGGGWDPDVGPEDPRGLRLQTALWLTACAPTAGAALPWWWDTNIEAHNLYPLFAAVGRFLKGEDRAGRYGQWVKQPLAQAGGVEVQGIQDTQGARLFVHRPAWVAHPETQGKDDRVLPQPTELALSELLDGRYRVEFWDAATGQCFQQMRLEAKDSVLRVLLPARQNAFALKVGREKR